MKKVSVLLGKDEVSDLVNVLRIAISHAESQEASARYIALTTKLRSEAREPTRRSIQIPEKSTSTTSMRSIIRRCAVEAGIRPCTLTSYLAGSGVRGDYARGRVIRAAARVRELAKLDEKDQVTTHIESPTRALVDLRTAALYISCSIHSLRARLRRAATIDGNGQTVAIVGGLTARKYGREWRCALPPECTVQ